MKLFIIGNGNVASTLSIAIQKAGHEIIGVYGRNQIKSNALAIKLGCRSYGSVGSIPKNCHIYLLAISDDAIKKFASTLPNFKGVVAHTSGSTGLNALSNIKNKGVFYPVETIKQSHPKSFAKVPICLEASNEFSLIKLLQLANSISTKTYLLNSAQRANLHLAAVLTNNFTNHLLGLAQDILDKNKLSKELLEQLAFTTIKNAFASKPHSAQTGPAARGDHKTIAKHLDLLTNEKEIQKIYKLLSSNIERIQKKEIK